MTRCLWDSTSTSYFKPPLDYFNPSEFCGKQLPNLLKVNGGQILNHFRRRDIFWPRQRGFSKQVTKVPWKNGLLRGKLVMKVPLMTELLLDHCWLQKKKKAQTSSMVFVYPSIRCPPMSLIHPHPLTFWMHGIPDSPNFLLLSISAENTSQVTLSSQYHRWMHKHILYYLLNY